MTGDPTSPGGHGPGDSTQVGVGETATYPTVASGLELPADLAGELGPEDDEWPIRGPARGVRLAFPAAALIGVLLVAAGFWGGAVVQKSRGGSSSSSAGGFAARFRAAGAGPTGAAGFSFGGGATGGTSGTVGTVSIVAGDTLYVLTPVGALVKVALDPSATITRNATTKAVDLRPGDTVVVQGSAGADGTVTATSVAATAPGVSSGGRGFGGGAASGGTSTTQGAQGG